MSPKLPNMLGTHRKGRPEGRPCSFVVNVKAGYRLRRITANPPRASSDSVAGSGITVGDVGICDRLSGIVEAAGVAGTSR